MVSFHVLLLDTAGNNLVNADFSPYFRMFFAVKYIYLTLYIVHICRVASTYSVPMYLLAVLFTAFTCPLSLRRRARWRSLSVLLAALAPCAWPRFRPSVSVLTSSSRSLPYPFPAPIMAHFIRLYGSFSRPARRVSAPPQTFLRSFSDSRYLSRRRPRRWVARLDIAIWADSCVLRCFDDLLTSHDIKKIFFKGVDSVRPSCYHIHVNRKDTHDRRIQARHTRPTDRTRGSK